VARWTYFKSNGDFNDFHREWDGLAGIDVDFCEVCPHCYEPLCVIETAFDKGQNYKATKFVEILSERLQIPSFLVFYRRDDEGVMWIRYKLLKSSMALVQVRGDEFIRELYQLQESHRKCCKYAT
jgi:hypothetical protein